MTKVLLVGSGGREDALLWKLHKDNPEIELFCTPGNFGMMLYKPVTLVPIQAGQIDVLADFAKLNGIDLTIVGPEDPLVGKKPFGGIVDYFQNRGLHIFGASEAAAQLEGSKVFAKEFMRRNNIPTADFVVCPDAKAAVDYVTRNPDAYAIKADGLAAGKGVILADTLEAQIAAIDRIMVKKEFGDAGNRIVIEKKLKGVETSLMVITDGNSFVTLPTAKDYKAVYENDADRALFERFIGKKLAESIGENTGGMGSISPSPYLDATMMARVEREIVIPTIEKMAHEGNPYRSVIYIGLMLTEDGPQVLEYNCRFGDPETQPQMMRLKSNLLEIIDASLHGELLRTKVEEDARPSVCLVAASGGYPQSQHIKKGFEIMLPNMMNLYRDAAIFFAGVKGDNGRLVTSGGRVLGVTTLGQTMEDATRYAYEIMSEVAFERMYTRLDIGTRGLR